MLYLYFLVQIPLSKCFDFSKFVGQIASTSRIEMYIVSARACVHLTRTRCVSNASLMRRNGAVVKIPD